MSLLSNNNKNVAMNNNKHDDVVQRRKQKHHLHSAFLRAMCVTTALYTLVMQFTAPPKVPFFSSTAHQMLSRRNTDEGTRNIEESLAITNAIRETQQQQRQQQQGGTNLGNNRLITQTDVSYQAAIAYDVMEIYKALRQENYDRVLQVYTRGENSLIFVETVEGVEEKMSGYRSLSSMSKSFAIDTADKNDDMMEEEVHNVKKGLNFFFSVYGLAKGDVDIVHHYGRFADSYVKKILEQDQKQAGRKANNEDANTIAGEAMVVLNLWMFATHKVWSSLAYCRGGYGHSHSSSQQEQQQEQPYQTKPNEAAIQSLDEFVAYWYGLGFDNSDNNLKEEGGTIMTDLHPHGYLLYDITEKASNYFGTSFLYSDIGQEAKVNTNIRMLYSQAISLLYEPSTCYNPDTDFDLASTSSNYQEFYKTIQQLISQIQVPLIQHLIHALYIDDDNKERIELYAMSIVPQLISVSKTTHGYLQSKLIDHVETYNPKDDFTNVVKAIYSTLSPLGISCNDIGQYYQTQGNTGSGKAFPPCIDPSSNNYPHKLLANYNPTTTKSTTYYTSTIDLDILQIKILMKLGAHMSAQWIYESGRHSFQTLDSDGGFTLATVEDEAAQNTILSATYQSLKQMATNRNVLLKNTWYGNYVGYMKNNVFFGDALISSVLALSNEELRDGHEHEELMEMRTKWKSISQHTEAVSKSLQFLVLHPYAIGLMYLAVEQCFAAASSSSGENTQVSRAGNEQQSSSSTSTFHIEQTWDEAASYLIGSLEGQYELHNEISYMYHDENYDTQYGFGLYALANARCKQFQTCSSSSSSDPEESSSLPERAKITSAYRDLLYAGKGQIESLQCNDLKQKTIKQIQRWSLIPIIQSIIRYAIKGAEIKKAGSKLKVLAEGEIFALVILPLMQQQQGEQVEQQGSRAGSGGEEQIQDMEEIGDGGVHTDQSIIERNMIVQPGVKPVQDGPHEVAKALSTIVEKLDLPCEFIGETSGITPCHFIPEEGAEGGSLQEGSLSGSNSKGGISVTWLVVVCSLAIGIFSMLYPYVLRCLRGCLHVIPF